MRVFAIAGAGYAARVQDLRLDPGLELVSTPRAANVLLVAGEIAPPFYEALQRTHDAVAHPRATVCWGGAVTPSVLPGAETIAAVEQPSGALRRAFDALLDRSRPSEPALLPDEDPAPWRGVGPFGQGGSGMTGGVPYGRPMAELAADRDGLKLDALPIALGPFSPLLPAGVSLDLVVAGDVVTRVAVATKPGTPPASADVFARAVYAPQPIALLERSRAESHLRWLADALRLHGLGSLALRATRLATEIDGATATDAAALVTAVRRTGVLTWAMPARADGAGDVIRGSALGPLTRAAGVARDARLLDPVYGEIGFRPVTGIGDDARARWTVRLGEIVASLALAARAGDRRSTVTGAVEGPRGPVTKAGTTTSAILNLLPVLVEGLEWGDAMATIWSLDLDPGAAWAPAAVETQEAA